MDINNYLEFTETNLNLLEKYSNKFYDSFDLLEIYYEDDIEDYTDLYYIEDKCLKNIDNISNNLNDYRIVKRECSNLKKNFNKIVNKLDNKELFFDKIFKPVSNVVKPLTETLNFNSIINPIKELPDRIVRPLTNTFGDLPNRIVRPLTNTLGDLPNRIVKPIINIINNIAKIMRDLLHQIKNISEKTGNIIKKVVHKIFETVLYIFNLIKTKVIPFIKKIIGFIRSILRELPGLIRFIAKTSIRLAKVLFRALIKFKKSPLFPIILFILLFFGIQIYFKFITGLPLPLPPIISALFSLYIVVHTLIYRYPFVEKYNNEINKILIDILKNSMIGNLFGIKKEHFKNRKEKTLDVILIIMENLPTFIFSVLFLVLIIKILIKMGLKRIIRNQAIKFGKNQLMNNPEMIASMAGSMDPNLAKSIASNPKLINLASKFIKK